jgi:hypothetical protein
MARTPCFAAWLTRQMTSVAVCFSF